MAEWGTLDVSSITEMTVGLRKWGGRNCNDGVHTSPWMNNDGYLGLRGETWRLVWWVSEGMHFLGEACSRIFPFNIKKFNSWTSPPPSINSSFFAPCFPLRFLFSFPAKKPLILSLCSSKIPSTSKDFPFCSSSSVSLPSDCVHQIPLNSSNL